MTSNIESDASLVIKSNKSAERLESDVKYIFRFGSPQYEVNFHVTYSINLNSSDFIFKVRLYADESQEPVDSSSANWAFSKIAKSMYVYSPPGEAGSVHTLKALRSTSPFTRAEFEPVRWLGRGASPESSVGDVLATYSNRSYGTGLMVYKEVLVVSTKEQAKG